METIYCQNCKYLEERKGMFGPSIHCLEFNTHLRTVPMDENNFKFPIKCLECIEKGGENV
jgi:hypothetical protein